MENASLKKSQEVGNDELIVIKNKLAAEKKTVLNLESALKMKT